MKVAPLHRAFSREAGLESVIVHTGQHYDERMSQVFFDQLGLPKPHHFLGIGGGTHTEQTARIMLAYEKVLDAEKPDLVIVVGDVNSTVACALTAVKKQIKVAHVEAGLRSGDRRMPEEINRIVTDAICDLLFVSEQSGVDHLLAEGIARDRIHFVGNIMIDSLAYVLPQADQLDTGQIVEENLFTKDQSPKTNTPKTKDQPTKVQPPKTKDQETKDQKPKTKNYILMTMHRPSNVDSKASLQKIIEIVKALVSEVSVVFPLHPRTAKNLESFGLLTELQALPEVLLTQPLGYLEFIKMMKEARLVITDSGGIQEETTWLRVPCITFRESTERPSTVTHGSNRLIKDLDVGEAVQKSREILSSSTSARNGIPPLWDGHTAERIVEVLLTYLTSLDKVNGYT
jgi:UDP-N-acetylglucosamine 2-epimerase (non-hydrolysing)